MEKLCKNCGNKIPNKTKINGITKKLTGRAYCLKCSPYGEMRGYELRKRKNKRSDEELKTAIFQSTSIRQTLNKLNLVESGANYKLVKKRISDLAIDTSHFIRFVYTPRVTSRIDLKDILVENSTYCHSNLLRKRLIKEGIFEQKCYNCRNTTWMNSSIPLELEHKNGINNDNRIENLTLLCPNCHALTETYRGKNIKTKRK